MGKGEISVAGGDGLALLRHAESATQSAGRLGANRAAGRAAAPGHRPPSTVEDREGDAMGLASARDRLLRSVERPVCREVATVLVAVRIADHHHLLAPACIEMRPVDTQREELRDDTSVSL